MCKPRFLHLMSHGSAWSLEAVMPWSSWTLPQTPQGNSRQECLPGQCSWLPPCKEHPLLPSSPWHREMARPGYPACGYPACHHRTCSGHRHQPWSGRGCIERLWSQSFYKPRRTCHAPHGHNGWASWQLMPALIMPLAMGIVSYLWQLLLLWQQTTLWGGEVYQRKLGSNTSELRMTFTWWNWLWWRVVRDWDLTLMKGGVRLSTT